MRLDFSPSSLASADQCHRYLISIGSNLDPEHNIPAALQQVWPQVSACVLSRIIATEPVGMVSNHRFLNLVAYLETPLSADRLKQVFNQVELALGRDRTDPLRKIKDRPIDLDIMAEVERLEDCWMAVATAPAYCQAILVELLAYLLDHPAALVVQTRTITIGSDQFGAGPKILTIDSL